jgi:hypothetical protein
MSYYPKEENQEPAPGTGSKTRYVSFEEWKKSQEEKSKKEALKFKHRFDADEDLKAHTLQESNKFK